MLMTLNFMTPHSELTLRGSLCPTVPSSKSLWMVKEKGFQCMKSEAIPFFVFP